MGWHSHPDQPQPDTLNDNVVTEARQNPTRKVQHQARSKVRSVYFIGPSAKVIALRVVRSAVRKMLCGR